MDYAKIYNSLISRGQSRIISGYTETHHIVPKCMGGTNAPENLVELTPEEHYLAHQLLVKMHPSHRGLISAVMYMTSATTLLPFRSKNKLFGWHRRRFSEYMKTTKKWNKGAKGLQKANSGSFNPGNPAWNKGLVGNFAGKKHSADTLLRISTAAASREKMQCVFCGKFVTKQNLVRSHNNNCKENPHISIEVVQSKARTAERKKIAFQLRASITCPHCKKQGKHNMHRYHFDNCKFIGIVPYGNS